MGMGDFWTKMYGKYFAPLPDKDAYLARIGLSGEDIPLTREGLDKVLWAHLCNVPFENIDLFDYNGNVDFGIEEMFDKVVIRRRGGYCFELNSLFMSLLQALGFEIYPIGVRIFMGGSEQNVPAIAHRASLIVIDGKRYYADVGFGMTSAPGHAICVDDYEKQDIRGTFFSVEDRPYNHKMIMMHTENGPSTLFMFIPDPFQIVDFISFNTTIQMTGFRQKRMVNLRTNEGSRSIDGAIFRQNVNGVVTETPISSPDEALKILGEHFGMPLTEPLAEIAEKPVSWG